VSGGTKGKGCNELLIEKFQKGGNVQPSDELNRETQAAWQTQINAPLVSSLLRRSAREFRWRFQLDRFCAALVHVPLVVYFGATALAGDALLTRAGSGLFAAGAAYALFRFLGDSRFSALPPNAVAGNCLAFYGDELTHRSRAAKDYWRSCILPTLPGAILGSISWAASDPQGPAFPLITLAIFAVCQYSAYTHQEGVRIEMDKEIELLNRSAGGQLQSTLP
jgi:hypothetical protein